MVSSTPRVQKHLHRWPLIGCIHAYLPSGHEESSSSEDIWEFTSHSFFCARVFTITIHHFCCVLLTAAHELPLIVQEEQGWPWASAGGATAVGLKK
jgi:uncharacterized membrane protein